MDYHMEIGEDEIKKEEEKKVNTGSAEKIFLVLPSFYEMTFEEKMELFFEKT